MIGFQKQIIKQSTVILANGLFPNHPIPLNILKKSDMLICCDGAVDKLKNIGKNPDIIIGDMDSISNDSKSKNKGVLIHNYNQDQNDLYKSLLWCISNNVMDIVVLGASGKREDHTIRNMFQLFDFSEKLKISMITDNGIINLINNNTTFHSYSGQQVSIIINDLSIKLSTNNLKYALKNECLPNLYYGTLNESISDEFQINISHGSILVYQNHSN